MRLERWYVAAAVAILAVGVVALLAVMETGIARTQEATLRLQASTERQQWLIAIQGLLTDAESAQRGYLLTADVEYLEPYERARAEVGTLLDRLRDSYQGGSSAGLARVADLRQLAGEKMAELQGAIELFRQSGFVTARQLVRTDVGRDSMNRIRTNVRAMLAQERQFSLISSRNWLRERAWIRAITVLASIVNIGLLIVTGVIVLRELRSRHSREAALEAQVAARTAELSDLSSHLQQVAEAERSHLARELHDELGGLLVAVKMDLAQLARQVDLGGPGVQERWDRIQQALAEGVALKRRVIEELRPTLLDAMGLVAALRWQLRESCGRAGLECTEALPEEEPRLRPEAAIALFRVAQEAMTNTVKHAGATAVELHLDVGGDELEMVIRDNGQGLDGRQGRGHGLASMRHRVRSLGGSFAVRRPASGRGTEIQVRVPMAGILQGPDGDADLAVTAGSGLPG